MKNILILIILFFNITDSFAQKPWKWTQLKGPNIGRSTHKLMFDENGDIISVTPLGYYVTTNEGSSWICHHIIPLNDWNCPPSYFGTTNNDAGLLISPTGEYYFAFWSCNTADSNLTGVYRSTDKGISWQHVMKSFQAFQLAMGQNNSILAFGATYNANTYKFPLFQSIDKGNSWTELYESPNAEFEIIGSSDTYLYVSVSGIFPEKISYADYNATPFNEGLPGSVLFKTTQLKNDLFMGYFTDTIYTSDGVGPWKNAGILMNEVNFVRGSGDTIYSSVYSPDSRNLFIDFTTDEGSHWNTYTGVSIYNGSSFAFNYENSNKLLFENDTALYLSSDRSNSWKEIGLPFDSISRILVTETERIIAEPADQYYTIPKDTRESSDKGETWKKTQPSQQEIIGIGRGINNGIIAIAPDSSDPNDYVWLYDSASPTHWKKRSILEYLANHPLIATDGTKSTYISTTYPEPTIYRSDDNLFSWIDIEAPNTGNTIYSLDASTDGTLYFGSYPVMYRSDDLGSTWTKIIPVNDIVKLTYIKTFGLTGVLLGTEGDGLLISNDKGNSWTRIDNNNFDTVTCIGITSVGEIAAGTNRGLWILDSAKQNWTKVLLGQEDNLPIGSLDVSNTDDFYVGTYGASAWIGSRHYNATKYPDDKKSIMRLSPNPATDRISITLESTSDSQATLGLYDILGRKVAVLANGTFTGENKIYFDVSSLPSGSYTIILSGSSNESQNIIINH